LHPWEIEVVNNTIQQSLRAAKFQLMLVADDPILEAEILLAHAINESRSYLHAWPENMLSDDQAKQFIEFVRRRCTYEPIAYITGHREFWSLDFLVTKDTLIPRPETELLVESVLALYGKENLQIKVADLGTGSGAIALALAHERPTWQIYATDASENALQVAIKNAQRLALENIYFCQGNWFTALPSDGFDVIVSNPPYIGEVEWEMVADGLHFEPRMALVSNQEGLEAIRTITHSAKLFLKPTGYVLIEHGFLQGAAVRKLFAACGYSHIHTIRDLARQERVTMGQYLP
jgi:release factor glutamine methyltransferase